MGKEIMKCTFIKDNGEQCKAYAMTNSSYCFLHNPDIDPEAKRSAQIQGGKTTLIKVAEGLPTVKVKSPQDVAVLLEQTINEVREGSLPPQVANCIGYLAGGLLKAFELGDIESRLTSIEDVIKH